MEIGSGNQVSINFRRFIPIPIAALVLVQLVWSVVLLIQHPYPGFGWSFTTGIIKSVDANGSAAGHLRVDDRILSIDGRGPHQARGLPGLRAGDTITLTVSRGPETFQTQIELETPSRGELIERLSVIPIALSFWLLAVITVAYTRSNRQANLFFLFSQAFAVALGTGSISAIAPVWVGWVFTILLWWVGPIAIHLHLVFVNPTLSGKYMRRIPFAVYGMAFLFSLLDVRRGLFGGLQTLFSLKYVWLSTTLILAVLYLVAASQRNMIKIRQKGGFVSLTLLVGFLPFILSSLLPDAFFKVPILPYNVSLLFLTTIPLGYSYAILRYKLIHLDYYVNRSIAYSLVVIIVGGLYGLVYLTILNAFSRESQTISLVGVITTIVFILTAHPMYSILQRMVDRVFYGGWYDDQAAVEQITQTLQQSKSDIESIGRSLCQAIQTTMQLEYVNLLLNGGQVISTDDSINDFSAIVFYKKESVEEVFSLIREKTGRDIGNINELPEIIPQAYATQIILGRKPHLWLLLSEGSNHLGLLILSQRRGGGEFTPRSLELLKVVMRQAGVALENARLLEEVRQYSGQIKNLHRQVLQAREDERKRVARNLHDKTIQILVGLNYQLAATRTQLDEEVGEILLPLQDEVREILKDLRQVCVDLRPPALDSLGLVETLRSRISEIQAQAAFDIVWQVEGDEKLDIHEDAAVCLYRFFQEAILNIQKHAEARLVIVNLQVGAKCVSLSISDDGKGFQLLQPLSLLAQQQHFGLVGLQEMLESVEGTLEIDSSIGQGCRITANVPLAENKFELYRVQSLISQHEKGMT